MPAPGSSSPSRSPGSANERHHSGVPARCTEAPTCSSGCRGAGMSSSRRARRSRIRSGSRVSMSTWSRGRPARLPAARRRSTGSSRKAAPTRRTGGGCCCAAHPASTSTRCGSTSRESRCARCTGATTARRGQLMVKELEDAPRDEIAVLLDADASAASGESFDVQVRAAGLDPPGPRRPRPPCRPRDQLGITADRARRLARRRVAHRSRAAGGPAAGRHAPGRRAARRARAARPRGRSRP